MAAELQNYIRRHDYLICVDSDGCAMDTMEIKHRRCFGPCLVREWGLEEWSDQILARWNEINLYSMTRGVSRFVALASILEEIDGTYVPVKGIEVLKEWVRSSEEFSNPALEKAIEKRDAPILRKALRWSRAVNKSIAGLPWGIRSVFPGVREALETVRERADIALVSSANRDAVEEEWSRARLLGLVDTVLCQEAGSKAHSISELMRKGYGEDRILMVGDAPVDKAAAEISGVCFYPILVKREAESWAEFADAAERLFQDRYRAYEMRRGREFIQNLSRQHEKRLAAGPALFSGAEAAGM